MSAALIWTTLADEPSAADIVSQMLDEKLVACANLFPGLRSLFLWRGERGEAQECGVLFKTQAALLEQACARLSELHPYDTPAVSGWRADATAPAMLDWLSELDPRARLSEE